MSSIIPPNRPQAPREKVLSAMRKWHRDQGKEIAPVTVVVAPGYFSKTFGEPGNDRVKYINALREIVGRRMPKNKSGSPLTSDVDLLMAENEEIAEALLRTIKKWKP